MDGFVESSLLLGAFINFATARFAANILGSLGSTYINWLRLTLMLSMATFACLGIRLAAIIYWDPGAHRITAYNVLVPIACIGLCLAGLHTARQVQREFEAKEAAAKGGKGP